MNCACCKKEVKRKDIGGSILGGPMCHECCKAIGKELKVKIKAAHKGFVQELKEN